MRFFFRIKIKRKYKFHSQFQESRKHTKISALPILLSYQLPNQQILYDTLAPWPLITHSKDKEIFLFARYNTLIHHVHSFIQSSCFLLPSQHGKFSMESDYRNITTTRTEAKSEQEDDSDQRWQWCEVFYNNLQRFFFTM